MIALTYDRILILILIAFIVGLIVGVALTQPRVR